MPKKKYIAKKTTDLHALELLGFGYVKLLKSGECIGKKTKKGATHILSGTKLSTLIEPVKKWPKPPKALVPAGREPIGAGPEEVSKPAGQWHPPVPPGATYAAYRWTLSGNLYMTPVTSMEELRDFRGGELMFGTLRYNEDFRILWPTEQAGNIIEWKTGRTVFAEGKDPASLKRQVKEMAAAAERLANPPAHVKEAFAAQVAKRRVPPGPQPGDVPGLRQNGVRKPGAGGKTARVWEICDELLKKLGRCPSKQEVLDVSVGKEKASPGMSGTQYSYWRRFYGHNAPAKA